MQRGRCTALLLRAGPASTVIFSLGLEGFLSSDRIVFFRSIRISV